MSVDRNISYVSAPTQSTGGPQVVHAAGQSGTTGTVAEYSRIGPSYETTDNSRRQQPVAGRNRVSARLSERYVEVHLAAAGGGGGRQGEGAMDYEISLQSREHEEYSHLQH